MGTTEETDTRSTIADTTLGANIEDTTIPVGSQDPASVTTPDEPSTLPGSDRGGAKLPGSDKGDCPSPRALKKFFRPSFPQHLQTPDENENKNTANPLVSTLHKASTPRTKEALRVFKLKAGRCEVETCEQKSIVGSGGETTADQEAEKHPHLCQNHLENGVEAPSKPAKRGRKRKTSSADEEEDSRKKPASASSNATTPTPMVPATPSQMSHTPQPSTPETIATPESEPRSRIKSCLVNGCGKLRAKSGFCLRHFKDKKAPIRSGPAEYERRVCIVEGCERLRSKGDYCHRHYKNPKAPIRNKSDGPVDRKKKCSIPNCDRLAVKGGFCSRHFRNRSAPVLTTPAFSFDADARWDELFPELQDFYKTNGHSRVPTSQKTDLARFVVHIRCVYRTKKQKMIKMENSIKLSETTTAATTAETSEPIHPDLTKSKLLTPERMEALKMVNFEFQLWTVEPSQWEQRFQELLAYRKEHGNFHVTNKQNSTLSRYIH